MRAPFAIGIIMLVACAKNAVAPGVSVSETTAANTTTYSYRVTNGSDKPIVGVRIGFDYPSGEAQLRTPPVGWTLENGLAPESAKAPEGWTVRLVTTEESDTFSIEWTNDGASERDIAPGASSGDFSVTVSGKPVAEYNRAKFDLILGDSTHLHGTVMAQNAH